MKSTPVGFAVSNLDFGRTLGIRLIADVEEFRVSDGEIHQQDTVKHHEERDKSDALAASAPLRVKLIEFFVVDVLTIV